MRIGTITLSLTLIACSGGSGDDGGGGSGGGGAGGDAGSGGDGAPVFGGTGIAAVPHGLAVQGSKLVVAGVQQGDFFVARFEPGATGEAQLDTTFGTNGITTVDLGGPTNSSPLLARDHDTAYDLAVTVDRIFLAGEGRGVGSVGGDGGFGLIVLDADGVHDTTFTGDGVLFSDWGNDAHAERVLLDGTGNIYLVGTIANAGNQGDVAVARYTSIGALDATYSATPGVGAGWVQHMGGDELGIAAALTPAGLVAGGGGGFPLTRHDNGGVLDATFAGDGTFASSGGIFTALVQESDGTLTLIGVTQAAGESTNTVIKTVRLDGNGNLDGTYGVGGVALATFDLTYFTDPNTGTPLSASFGLARGAVRRSADGVLFIYLGVLFPLANRPSVVALDADGAPYTAFGTNGLQVLEGSLPLLSDLYVHSANNAVLLDDMLWLVDEQVVPEPQVWLRGVALP